MKTKRQKEIYVIGHKNPDTDSICSAIAYASLKNDILGKLKQGESAKQYQDFLIENEDFNEIMYVPARAGQMSTETDYVLDTFGLQKPMLMNVIRTQVSDINIRRIQPISKNYSLRQAWETMRDKDTSTLAITDSKGVLMGLITMSDITSAYMSLLNNEILSEAHTPIVNILDTLKGTLVVGDKEKILDKGKLVVSTATLSVIDEYIHPNDLVILGNRYEAQLSAIENKASCMIICDGARASRTICKLAEENGCAIICTPLDTFTVTRTIHQSIPVGFFMIKEGMITFNQNDYVSDIKPTMVSKRHRDFLIVDDNQRYVGMISRRTLIGMDAKKVILVDHNEVEQAADGVDEAEVVEIIDHHKLGTVETIRPVKVRNEPLGCTATIVYEMYIENQIPISKAIAGILCSAIISDTLMFRSPTCTPMDRMAAEQLAEIAEIDIETYAMKMFEEGSQLSKKTEFEIFYQDFKKFNSGDICYGVGQITSVNRNELLDVQERLLNYMESAMRDTNTDMVFFMLTDILKESTRLLFVGKDTERLVELCFGKKADKHFVDIEGMVSRKKQLIPKLALGLQS